MRLKRTGSLLLLAVLISACAASAVDGQSAGVDSGEAPTDDQVHEDCTQDCSQLEVGPCEQSVCDTGSGACVTKPVDEGASCDDGLFCTVAERCVAGECTGGKSNTCGEDIACRAIACDEESESCSVVETAPDGTDCISTDLCQVFSTCQAGECLGTPKDCQFAPVPSCHVGACNPETGACDPEPGLDGELCEDVDDLCTVEKTCLAGTCQGGAPMDCSALGDGCNVGICDAQLGCVAEQLPSGTSCAEGSDDCNAGTCDAAGVCHAAAINDGGSCDDGLSCTTGSTCTQGICAGGQGDGLTIYFADDFSDASAGWQLGPEWEIGAAAASMGAGWALEDPEWDHSPSYNDGVAGVVLGGHAQNNAAHPMSYLESPSFDTTGTGPVSLSFARWLNTALSVFVYDTVEVFDGGEWVLLWHNAGGGVQFFADEWIVFSYDITEHRSATTRIRFGFQAVASAFPLLGSWNVDDVVVANQSCL